MKRAACLLLGFLGFCIHGFSASPVLSASATQPVYPGTSKPYLTIVSGSAKTSYVSGVINDPTDPGAVYGIYFTVSVTGTTVAATSSKTSVVPAANLTISESGGVYTLKIQPTGVGYTDIKVTAKNADGTSSAYTIKYAASAASANPSQTIFPVSMADASGASAVDNEYMFVADDERNILRLNSRTQSGQDLYNIDITSAIGATEETDLEGASTSVKYNSGKRIYWIGSLGNSKSGNLKPDRDRVVATEVNGTGASSTLTVKSYAKNMRAALISWGNSNTWNFTASAAEGMVPKLLEGFNVEGLTVTHGGDTGYIGFRAPCVPLKGIIPSAANRIYAIVAPVSNFETILNGNGLVTTIPLIGEPILFDLAGLGIRSIERVGTNLYLIVAGLYTGGGTPAVYLWDGKVPANPGLNPITTSSAYSKLIKLNLPGLANLSQVSSDGVAEGHPEAMIAEMSGTLIYIHLICDNGTIDYYNDGTEAKSLSRDQYKKFRYDNFVYDTDTTNYISGCSLSTTRYLATATPVWGDTYQWQVNTGSGYTNIGDGDLYSGTTSYALKIVHPSSALTGYQYRCVITHNAVAGYSQEFVMRLTAYWTGAVSTAWEEPANWGTCGVVPDSNTDVIINTGTAVLHASTTIRSLSVSASAKLTVNTGANLNILQ